MPIIKSCSCNANDYWDEGIPGKHVGGENVASGKTGRGWSHSLFDDMTPDEVYCMESSELQSQVEREQVPDLRNVGFRA